MSKYRYIDIFTPDMNDGNHVFVFGSNLRGIHGAGAAKEAVKHWGARNRKGFGQFKESYAIPTKLSWQDGTELELVDIQKFVDDFIECAKQHPEITFLVTPIGTGYAGYEHSDIAPMFKNAPTNCVFVPAWKEFLELPGDKRPANNDE